MPRRRAKPVRRFKKSESVMQRYRRQLRQVAREIGRIVSVVADGTAAGAAKAAEQLRRYADLLNPWARQAAWDVAVALNQQDENLWRRQAKELSLGLRKELEQTPTGAMLKDFLDRNVHYITSLPTEAAARVHQLTQQALTDSKRADEIKADILRTGHVTASRADTIARTETSRTANELVRARAEQIGSTHFIWRTAEDADVRADHRRLNGKTFRFDDPPVADSRTGERALPGSTYNCRCYAEPILPE